MKRNCALVKDLLPLYIDELCSEETGEFIREHLDECEDCRKDYNAAAVVITPTEIDDTPVKPFRKIRFEIIKRVIIIVACLAVVGALVYGACWYSTLGIAPEKLENVTVTVTKNATIPVAHYSYPEWADQKRIEFAATDTVVIDEKTHRLLCNGKPVVNPDDPDSFVGDKGCHGLYVTYGNLELTFSGKAKKSFLRRNGLAINDFNTVEDVGLYPVLFNSEFAEMPKIITVFISTQNPEQYLRIVGSNGVAVYDMKETFRTGNLVQVDANSLPLPEPDLSMQRG